MCIPAFRKALAALLFLALLGGARPVPAQEGGRQRVDLQLLLAVDTSASVNPQEFDLQMRGLAEAFRHPGVHAALQAAGDLGIAVALMQWSDSRKQSLSIDWTWVHNPETAEGFAFLVEQTPRYLQGGGTAIGSAIDHGASLFARNSFDSPRRVIDVSGDGRANQGRLPDRARDDAVADTRQQHLLAIADDYESFSLAMTRKLIQEISGVPLSQRPEPKDGVAIARRSQ